MDIDEKSKIRIEIVKSFHEQFAQNQNHHQGLFLQVLAVLLTVITGFGYLYVHFGVPKSDIQVSIETIYVSLTLSLYLLSLAIALIVNMALGFRRDQLVACNIRVAVGGMDTPDNEGYFPDSFNPVKKFTYLNWMPEFHLIFLIALLAVKIIFLGSVVLNVSFRLIPACSPNWLLSASVFMILISFYIDGYVVKYYKCKWSKYMKDAPQRLKKAQARY